jgi:hypothetical protein
MTQNNPIVQGFFNAGVTMGERICDVTLQTPALILPSLQVNIRGGRLPPLSANAVRCLKLPLDRLSRSEAS